MDFTKERHHIHELANHLTIIQGAIRKVLIDLEKKKLPMDEERDRLRKADDYVKKSIEAIRDLRAELHLKIDGDE